MGPLAGVRVLEFAGIGPAPFAAMVLSDLGAEVVRVDRKGSTGLLSGLLPPDKDVLNRGRRQLALDLKHPEGVATALELVASADILIEGFRPGVMERLGLGPEPCLSRNPRLVYGRMTGWGQDGPLSRAAGHDINYVAVGGALGAIGERGGAPVPPLNLVGDFGGGGMLLAMGVLAALVAARSSGQGQVVDAAMTDGTALLLSLTYALKAAGFWPGERGTNLLDGGAPYYGTYRCADGRWIAVGPLEPAFYAQLLARIGATDGTFEQGDRPGWPAQRQRLAAVFATRSRDEWCALAEGSDACLSPVLELDEAPLHPHNRARGTFVTVEGVVQPAPAPRFSRTPAAVQGPPAPAGAHSEEVLRRHGLTEERIAALRQQGVIG